MVVCCLGLFFDNFDITIIGVVLPKLVSEWRITPVQTGMLASGGFIGMAIGVLLFGILADAIGRWKVFQITLLVYALLTGACALTTGFTSLFILRIAVGLGIGGLVPVDSAYLTEYVPLPALRQFIATVERALGDHGDRSDSAIADPTSDPLAPSVCNPGAY